jgi:hypothetical protein
MMLISHLEHSEHNVLADVEGYPVNRGIEGSRSLED